MTNPDELLTAAEAAELLGVSRATVHRMMPNPKQGRPGILTPAKRLPGGTGAILFHRSDIERVKTEREAAA